MNQEARKIAAAFANAIGRDSRRGGAPVLSADSKADDVAQWLQWNDRNGSYWPPDLAAADDFEPFTDETAWETLADVLSEDEEDDEDEDDE